MIMLQQQSQLITDSNIELSGSLELSERFAFNIVFDITNVGQCASSEVIQIYIKDTVCSIQRPLKELKAFSKVHLQQGQTRSIHLCARQVFRFVPV